MTKAHTNNLFVFDGDCWIYTVNPISKPGHPLYCNFDIQYYSKFLNHLSKCKFSNPYMNVTNLTNLTTQGMPALQYT